MDKETDKAQEYRSKYYKKNREYYQRYREKHKEKRSETYECECGAVITNASKYLHDKSTKHRIYEYEKLIDELEERLRVLEGDSYDSSGDYGISDYEDGSDDSRDSDEEKSNGDV